MIVSRDFSNKCSEWSSFWNYFDIASLFIDLFYTKISKGFFFPLSLSCNRPNLDVHNITSDTRDNKLSTKTFTLHEYATHIQYTLCVLHHLFRPVLCFTRQLFGPMRVDWIIYTPFRWVWVHDIELTTKTVSSNDLHKLSYSHFRFDEVLVPFSDWPNQKHIDTTVYGLTHDMRQCVILVKFPLDCENRSDEIS